MKKRILLAAALLLILTAPSQASTLVAVGYASCGPITAKINKLYPDAKTACQPLIDNGSLSILLTSALPILDTPETQRAWFVAGVAVVGYQARQAGLQNFNKLYMVDSESVKRFDAYAMPIARAAQIQQQVSNQGITTEAYVTIVMREMQPAKIPNNLVGKD